MTKKEVFIGFIIGLAANAVGLFIAALLYNNNGSVFNNIKAASVHGNLGQLISFGAAINLLVFFLFLRKKHEYRARGVLLATLFAALLTLAIKFF
ncbi:membrane protein [Mangrovimonas yunxiaonensis]|uniref:Membrane protein n=1 Tax=Mangrovimonas yunxiaonensis TaxID=1197477 RepID=A0A084TLQ0_9FLAO|nr:hypothetical protein [Mangrovimonas yunxiaonensis]KFB01636.1 membrane protein [Mangrovimonas yunxiaonensis]GGH35519.1 hypothetical protein GCM10011364_02120 [Mangrovimonas yunxiaonensis]